MEYSQSGREMMSYAGTTYWRHMYTPQEIDYGAQQSLPPPTGGSEAPEWAVLALVGSLVVTVLLMSLGVAVFL